MEARRSRTAIEQTPTRGTTTRVGAGHVARLLLRLAAATVLAVSLGLVITLTPTGKVRPVFASACTDLNGDGFDAGGNPYQHGDPVSPTNEDAFLDDSFIGGTSIQPNSPPYYINVADVYSTPVVSLADLLAVIGANGPVGCSQPQPTGLCNLGDPLGALPTAWQYTPSFTCTNRYLITGTSTATSWTPFVEWPDGPYTEYVATGVAGPTGLGLTGKDFASDFASRTNALGVTGLLATSAPAANNIDGILTISLTNSATTPPVSPYPRGGFVAGVDSCTLTFHNPSCTFNPTIQLAPPDETDGDGCPDGRELAPSHITGGQRNPNSFWDFFDVPTPPLLPSNTTGTRNHAISIGDAIAILTYIGTNNLNPNTPNANGATYGSDWNSNGIQDGQEYDRTPGAQAWAPGMPNGAVTIGDALIEVNGIGDNCN